MDEGRPDQPGRDRDARSHDTIPCPRCGRPAARHWHYRACYKCGGCGVMTWIPVAPSLSDRLRDPPEPQEDLCDD